jgi:Arc/MetJ-type ribon-helix-helix transcriptional regulator
MIRLDNNITNSDWIKARAFDFPHIQTLDDFMQMVGNIPLSSFADLPWVQVAPPEIRDAILASVEKGRFASRSEAGRYAANIRWQNNQKEEDDPKKRSENLRKKAESIADRVTAIQTSNPAFIGLTRVVTVPYLGNGGKPVLNPDGTDLMTEVEVFSEELMQIHDDMLALGVEIETEVMRRLGDDTESIVEEKRNRVLEELNSLREQELELDLLRSLLNYRGNSWREANQASLERVVAKYCTPEQAAFILDPTNISAFQWSNTDARKKIRTEIISILRKQFGANANVVNQERMIRIARLEGEIRDSSLMTAMADTTKQVLAEMFPVGGETPKTKTKSALAKIFQQDIQNYYPDALIKRVNFGNSMSDAGALTIKKVKAGGYYSFRDNEIATSGDTRTNLHEFMHNLAHEDRFFNFVEQAALDYRRFGAYEPASSTTSFKERLVTGAQPGYSSVGFDLPQGKYFTDRFADPYSGRIYPLGARETLTRGIEAVFYGIPNDVGLWRITAGALTVGTILNSRLLQKGRFASRSEAGRYAANIRWQNHQKEEDDPQKRADALRKRGQELADRAERLSLMVGEGYRFSPLSVHQYNNGYLDSVESVIVLVPLLSRTGKPTGKFREQRLYHPELMRLMDDVVAFGHDVETEVKRRIADANPDRLARVAELDRLVELATDEADAMSELRGDINAYARGWSDENPFLKAELMSPKPYTDLVRNLSEEQKAGLEDLHKAYGELKSLAAAKGYGEEYRAASDALDAKEQALLKSYASAGISFEASQALQAKKYDLISQRNAISNEFRLAQPHLIDLMKSMVSMGTVKFEASGMMQLVEKFQKSVNTIIPDALIQRTNDHNATKVGMKLKKTRSGGHYKNLTREIATDSSDSTNIHEFGHNLTYAMPFFRFAEKAYLDRRSMGRSQDSRNDTKFSERLLVGRQVTHQTTTEGYSGEGPYYRDDWSDTYAGRVYGDGARETLTRGLETLIGEYGDISRYKPDWDHWAFTAGSLIVGSLLAGGGVKVSKNAMDLRREVARIMIEKGRFASRSEAGRYAANMRWQGHIRNDVTQSIFEKVKENEGLTVKLLTGEEPVKGFVVAQREHTRIVKQEAFFDPKQGKAILVQYLKDKRDLLGGEQFLGLWHDKKHGEVVLDVCDNILDRDEAIRIGQERNQQSIWDAENFKEIPTGGTGDREQFGT